MKRINKLIEDPLLALVAFIIAVMLAGLVRSGGCAGTTYHMGIPHGVGLHNISQQGTMATHQRITRSLCNARQERCIIEICKTKPARHP